MLISLLLTACDTAVERRCLYRCTFTSAISVFPTRSATDLNHFCFYHTITNSAKNTNIWSAVTSIWAFWLAGSAPCNRLSVLHGNGVACWRVEALFSIIWLFSRSNTCKFPFAGSFIALKHTSIDTRIAVLVPFFQTGSACTPQMCSQLCVVAFCAPVRNGRGARHTSHWELCVCIDQKSPLNNF